MSDIYGVKVKIEPIDILNRLDKKDRERFNSCIFADIQKCADGSIDITCYLTEEYIDSNELDMKINYLNKR